MTLAVAALSVWTYAGHRYREDRITLRSEDGQRVLVLFAGSERAGVSAFADRETFHLTVGGDTGPRLSLTDPGPVGDGDFAIWSATAYSQRLPKVKQRLPRIPGQ